VGFGICLDGDRRTVTGWLERHAAEAGAAFDKVIPLHHRRQVSEAGVGWSSYVLILTCAERLVDAERFAFGIEEGDAHMRRLDRLRCQPGLDMFSPKRNSARQRRMVQMIEYVTSDPQTRGRYYRDQYEFSGPAMRRLYDDHRTGRFIGFELIEPIAAVEGMPTWDVIHVTGFTPTQAIRAVPVFWRAFDDSAAALGRFESGKEIVAAWDDVRVKRTVRVRQLWDHTVDR
jgi:hypothetical protein